MELNLRTFLAKIRNGRSVHPDEDIIDVLLDLYIYYFETHSPQYFARVSLCLGGGTGIHNTLKMCRPYGIASSTLAQGIAVAKVKVAPALDSRAQQQH